MRTKAKRPSPFVLAFWAILAIWMLYPFSTYGQTAQDALHDPVAGDLWRTSPENVYFTPAPQVPNDVFVRRFCEFTVNEPRCADYATLYTSAPILLPIMAVLARLGGPGATLVIRLGGAACYVAGILILFRRMGPRTPPLLPVLVASFLTPLALSGLGLGQTSPLLFLSACLGLRRTGHTRRAAAVGSIWLIAAAMKLFPLGLVVVLVFRRRWKVLAAAAALTAVLLGLVLLLGPPSIVTDYVGFMRLNTGDLSGPVNGAPRMLLSAIAPGTKASPAGAIFGAALIGGAVAIWWRFRRCSLDVQWSLAYLMVMILSPVVWLHYCWLVIAAIGVIAADRDEPGPYDMALMGAAAAMLGLLGVVSYSSASYGVYLAGFLVVVMGALAWIEPPASRSHAARRPEGQRL